jgi:hypothetical protein
MKDQETCQSEVFIAGKADGVGDKGSGDTTAVNLETLGSLRTTFLNCQRVRISALPVSRLKEFYCTNL